MQPASTAGATLDVNAFRPLATAMLIAVIGPEVFIIQPGVVQGMVQLLGYTDSQAGYVASLEMYGIAATTIAMSFISHRVNWRHVTLGALGIIIAGNLASMFITSLAPFMVIRFVVGLGCGFMVSLGFAIVGLTARPERNFGWLIVWVLTYGAIVLYAMPWLFALGGMAALFAFLAAFTALALPLVRFVPRNGAEHVVLEQDAVEIPRLHKALALAAVLSYFMAQGVVWAYLFLIGLSGGLSEAEVTTGLTLSQLAGIAGGLTAVGLGARFGRAWPLALAILGTLLPLAFLFGSFTALVFGVAVGIYNYAWNITHPFLLAAMASFDRSGRVVVHAATMQMLGLATGPAIAATVIRDGWYTPVNWLGMALFGLCLLLILPPVRIQHRLATRIHGRLA